MTVHWMPLRHYPLQQQLLSSLYSYTALCQAYQVVRIEQTLRYRNGSKCISVNDSYLSMITRTLAS